MSVPADIPGRLLTRKEAPTPAMLHNAFAQAGIEYQPAAVACTLDAFRLLEPLAADHHLESLCKRRGIHLADAHSAASDALATAALLRLLLHEGIAQETIQLDREAFMRVLRVATRARPRPRRSAASSRSDTRPGSTRTASSSSSPAWRPESTSDTDP
jgi:DNA polymerase III epsilon subunit-like protein